MGNISVCALLYGPHYDLHKRCLKSILDSDPHESVKDFRVALHDVEAGSGTFVYTWAELMGRKWKKPVYVYRPSQNLKYPTMRWILRHKGEEPGDYIMWFDDDSYLTGQKDFWPKVSKQMLKHDMIGQHWFWPPQGNQLGWIKDQPWYNPDAGDLPVFRAKSSFEFCQGAWWVARRQMLLDLNWPVPELRHCGGDSMLGEAIRHQGYSMGGSYQYGVRINANDNGAHSKAKRRGYRERAIGYEYDGTPLSTGHQDFDMQWDKLHKGIGSCNY
jgi:hypothetical protein